MSRFEFEPEKAVSMAKSIAIGGLGAYLIYNNRRLQTQLTEKNKEVEQLFHDATHDSLTNMLNRRGLEHYLALNKPPKAFLYVDGTNQKAVNDEISHERGDEAILGTANIVRNSLRPNDIAARIGGDEFLVALDTNPRYDNFKNEKPTGPRSPEDILGPVTERIQFETDTYLGANPDLVAIGFNIAVGGAVWDRGMSVADVQNAAEIAMYEAKSKQHAAFGKHR